MNTFSDPQKIIDQCDIFPGQQVADLGAGSGAYTLAVAKKIASDPNSRVFAVDIQKDLLTRIDQEVKESKLDSVHIIWGDIEQDVGTRLKSHSINTVLLANTLFQVDDKSAVLKEVQRILHPEGRLILIDWAESFGNIGPTPDHVVTEEAARALCEEVGLVFERSIDAGEHHYGFIMRNQ